MSRFFRTTSTSTSTTTSVNSELVNVLFYITTNNLTKVKEIIKASNVNSIIDNKNGYNSLHYAITFKNEELIKYLLSIGADPFLKTNDHLDAYDLCLEYKSKTCIIDALEKAKADRKDFDTELKNTKKKLDSTLLNNTYLQQKNEEIVTQNTVLKSENKLLKKDFSDLSLKYRTLTADHEKLDKSFALKTKENDQLKTKNIDLSYDLTGYKVDFKKLDEEHKTLKRKYKELDDTCNSLIDSKRKA